MSQSHRVAVVTDSTAMIPPGLDGVRVVPTQVIIDGEVYDEGRPESSPEAVAIALSARKPLPVSTSRPSPARFTEVYEDLAAGGFDEIVSIHLSAEVSGTVESARIAAQRAPVPVVTLDTRAAGPCLGLAVAAAVAAVKAGASAREAAAVALERADRTRSFFYVNTLEHLRRGGRIGAGAALLGSALAVKPLLAIENGRIVLHERVRTSARALARLEELAVEAAEARPVDVVVAHLRAADRAGVLAKALVERLGAGLGAGTVRIGELGAVLGVHVGPGMLAVVVAPALVASV